MSDTQQEIASLRAAVAALEAAERERQREGREQYDDLEDRRAEARTEREARVAAGNPAPPRPTASDGTLDAYGQACDSRLVGNRIAPGAPDADPQAKSATTLRARSRLLA